MQRVKRSTAVAVLPATPAGGTPGYFAAPDPAGGVPATVPGYEWYNAVQEELMAVIEGQGLVASGTDRTQLRQAIAKMIQTGQRSVIINSATFAGAVTGTGKAVYWDSANSRFDLALADGSAKQNMVGFADVANANVYAFGDAVLFTGLTPGARYYLDGTTAGAITVTAPSNAVFLGIARTATEVFVDIDVAPTVQVHGQCRLQLSAGSLKLTPFNGNKLVIGGVAQPVPAAGVTLAATGMNPSTLYYIYAYMVGVTMTLEASTTGHSTDATTGVEIKTGDVTRTLVGLARPITGPAWADSAAQRFVLSWFNRRRITSVGLITANRATASGTFVELGLVAERAEFLCWGDDDSELGLNTVSTTASGGVSIDIMPGTDGANNMIYSGSRALTINANEYIPHAKIGAVRLSEGYHYQAIFGQVSGGATLTIMGGGYSNNFAIVQG